MIEPNFIVLVAGTFDGIHLGHLKLLEFARKTGLKKNKSKNVKIWVIIARDSNVLKIKGKLPIHNQTERMRIIKSLKQVDNAILGHQIDFFRSVEKIRPDLIVLGYDQSLLIEKLLKGRGYKVNRAPSYKQEKIKTKYLKKSKFQKSI